MTASAAQRRLTLDHPRRLHMVGIGGVGMSALATVVAAMGHQLSGSDLKEAPVLDRLRIAGIEVSVGHDPANVHGVDAVVVSSAIPSTNTEVVEAERLGVPVLRRAELLSAVVATRRTAAVAGTHGKTTTTSMLALILAEAGWHPSFVVGGELNEIGTGAAWDDGEWLVVEADESDGTFLELSPELAIVTNVEADHLDYYGDFLALVDAFRRFLASAPLAVVGSDDPVAARLAAQAGATTVGRGPLARWQIDELGRSRDGSAFVLSHDGAAAGTLELAVPGAHNVTNAAVAAAAALELGVPFSAARRALGRFAGVARRFQFRGVQDGVTFIDDYAHLPGEVRAVVAAARDGRWDRVVAVFQPHRYTRTAALWADFGDAFSEADVVVVTDVYAAGEQPHPGVTGRLVAEAITGAQPDKPVTFVAALSDLVPLLRATLRPGDCCLLLGAGDVAAVIDDLLAGDS